MSAQSEGERSREDDPESHWASASEMDTVGGRNAAKRNKNKRAYTDSNVQRGKLRGSKTSTSK